MPVELQVIRANEFIRLDPSAHLDLEASRATLRSLAHACRTRGIDSALLDLRKLPIPPKPHFTPAELAALVTVFRDTGFSSEQRLAILYRSDIHGGVRNFAFISRMRGMNVQAFTDFEQALNWLSEGQQEENEREEAAVPIHKVKKAANKLLVNAGTSRATRERTRPRA